MGYVNSALKKQYFNLAEPRQLGTALLTIAGHDHALRYLVARRVRVQTSRASSARIDSMFSLCCAGVGCLFADVRN